MSTQTPGEKYSTSSHPKIIQKKKLRSRASSTSSLPDRHPTDEVIVEVRRDADVVVVVANELSSKKAKDENEMAEKID